MTEQHTKNIRRKKDVRACRPKENTPKYANTNESRSIVWNVVMQSEPQKPATNHRTPEKPQTASAHRKSQNRSGSTEKTIQPFIKNIQKTRKRDTRKNTVFYNNKQFRRRKKGGAALNSSRELAYLSTVSDVRELNCRVRNGSGWNLSAMAAESPKPSSRFERE